MPERAGHSENVPEAAIAEQERFRVRLMAEGDLAAIVRVDGERRGSPTAFHAGKLTACLREPGINTSLVAEADRVVVGFLMGRLFFGEFGVPLTRAVLDWMAVLPAFAHQGAAHALFEQYVRNVRGLGVEAIDTLVEWDRFDLLGFFRSVGFRPSRDVDLVWSLEKHPYRAPQAAVLVREAGERDMAAVSAIDGEAIRAARPLYFAARLRAVRERPERGFFLVAERDGRVLGFIAGSLYQGEFGIDDLRGVIDSFAVAPPERNRGVGSALVAGLTGRMRPAGVRQMETLCRWNDWELLRFFERVGFRPSARLNLELRLGEERGG